MVALLLVGTAVGCTDTTGSPPATSYDVGSLESPVSLASTSPSDATGDCVTETQPAAGQPNGLEAQLLPDGLSGWALLFAGEPPWPQDERAKVVWRLDGEGELSAVAIGPSGERVEPDDLTPHGGSNWERPGEEWGSVWSFPRSGCWELRVTRGGDSASLEVLIA